MPQFIHCDLYETVMFFLVNLMYCRYDLYFRKNPFGGEYTIFAGLEECIRLVANFHFEEEDISFIQSVMPACEVQHLNFDAFLFGIS